MNDAYMVNALTEAAVATRAAVAAKSVQQQQKNGVPTSKYNLIRARIQRMDELVIIFRHSILFLQEYIQTVMQLRKTQIIMSQINTEQTYNRQSTSNK